MKRHPALVPFSHDHHDGLVHARRLRRAADEGSHALRDVAAAFLAFVDQDLEPHLRDEERMMEALEAHVAPGGAQRLTPHLQRFHSEHDQLRSSWERIREDVTSETPVRGSDLHELGELLHDHIRFEERELFTVLQSVVSDEALHDTMTQDPDEPTAEAEADAGEQPATLQAVGALRADLKALGASRRGIPWSAASRDLNITCLSWEPGHRIEAHRTSDRDVVVIGIDGSGTVTVEGVEQPVEAGTIVICPAGTERSIEAGPAGLVYVSMHRRREPFLPSSVTQPSA